MSFDESELNGSLPLEAGHSTKLSVKIDTSIPPSLKMVLDDRAADSPDDGNFFPRFIQPIADSPDAGEQVKPPHPERNKTLSINKKPPWSPQRRTNNRKKRSNTTDDVVDSDRRGSFWRSSSANVTRYGSPQLESRLSTSSSIDSLTLDTESQHNLPVYKLASAEFELEYTSNPGSTEGYYRKSKICITIRVLPTFHFSNFDILPCPG